MKIRPLHNQVIIKRKAAETKIGSLFVPEDAREKPYEGAVLAVGNGKALDNGIAHPCTVKVGDQVLFTKFAMSEIKLDGEEYVIVKEDAILAVIEK
jgi:chaperonin GroES